MRNSSLVHLAFISVIFACKTHPSFADDIVFELWRGNFTLSEYDCAERGSDGIIIDEPIEVKVVGSLLEIRCESIKFGIGES